MIRAFNFLYVENEVDWNNNYNAEWGRISHNVAQKPTQFPAFFKLNESWDSHSCGVWVPCDKGKMIQAFETDIAETQQLLNIIKGAE